MMRDDTVFGLGFIVGALFVFIVTVGITFGISRPDGYLIIPANEQALYVLADSCLSNKVDGVEFLTCIHSKEQVYFGEVLYFEKVQTN